MQKEYKEKHVISDRITQSMIPTYIIGYFYFNFHFNNIIFFNRITT